MLNIYSMGITEFGAGRQVTATGSSDDFAHRRHHGEEDMFVLHTQQSISRANDQHDFIPIENVSKAPLPHEPPEVCITWKHRDVYSSITKSNSESEWETLLARLPHMASIANGTMLMNARGKAMKVLVWIRVFSSGIETEGPQRIRILV